MYADLRLHSSSIWKSVRGMTLFATFILLISFIPPANVAFATAPQDFFKADGPLATVGELSEVFKLKTVGANLETELVTNYAEATASLNPIRQKLRAGGGSSSSSNGFWSIRLRGNQVAGHFGFGKRTVPNVKKGDMEFEIEIKEMKNLRRELSISAFENGTFSIQIRSPSQPFLFRLSQNKDQRIVCQELRPDAVFAAEANSFDQFCYENPEFVEERLLPILKFIGAGEPVTRFSPTIRDHVIQRLQPLDPAQFAEFEIAIDGLNGSSYEDRQLASSAIAKDFERWAIFVRNAISNIKYPVEVRSRLKKIYESHVSEQQKNRIRLAEDSALHEDAEYLIWLLSRLDSEGTDDGEASDAIESNKLLIASQLEEITRQTFGSDISSWQAWLAKSRAVDSKSEKKETTGDSQSNSPDIDASFQVELGPLNAASKFIGELVKLKLSGDRLIVDRNHWSQQFGGKSIAELNEEIREIVKSKNLPTTWYQPGGEFSADATDFPQVIFSRLAGVLGPSTQINMPQVVTRGGNKLSSLNREIDTKTAFARVEFHQPTQNEIQRMNQFGAIHPARRNQEPPKAEYFTFYFREKASPNRSIEIRESKDRALLINILAEETNALLTFVQAGTDTENIDEKSRFRVFEIHNGKTTEYSSQDFASLLNECPDSAKVRWMTVLKSVGIKFEKESE